MMRRGWWLFALAAAACGGSRPEPAATSSPARAPDTMAPVLAGGRVYYNDGPAFRDTVRQIVRDAASWQTMWKQVMSAQQSTVAAPTVNFDSEMIVVVAAGLMTPGDQIRVDSTGTRGGRFVVVVRTTAECQPFPASIYPHEVVRVTRSTLPVEWVEHVQRAPTCR
jgi:hypothetical protein